jgi:hypothetical protein
MAELDGRAIWQGNTVSAKLLMQTADTKLSMQKYRSTSFRRMTRQVTRPHFVLPR